MAYVSMKQMLETGVHFGHQTRRWNPKMRPFIFGARNGIHIIDLQQTVKLYRTAHDKIVETVANGGRVLFIGTKRQAQEAVAAEAGRAGQFHVTNRWMGGTLTNFATIQKSIERLKKLEAMFADGSVNRYQKKEILTLQREMAKLELTLGGIKDMDRLPQLALLRLLVGGEPGVGNVQAQLPVVQGDGPLPLFPAEQIHRRVGGEAV